MLRTLALTAGLTVVIAAASPQIASAVALGPYSPALKAGGATLVEPVQFRCGYWNGVCASRWGVGSWRFYRCMRLHGC